VATTIMFRQRRQPPGIAIWLLAMQMYGMGLSVIPPVTFWTVLVQAAIYLRLLGHHLLPSVSNVCISTANVWYRREWQRLFLGALWHLDDWHLYYNMISFLWKGRTLERRMGSGRFLLLLIVFTGLVSVVTVGLGFVLAELTDDLSYLSQCAAGFSGILCL
jgi:rhomboid domain-containing protein 1